MLLSASPAPARQGNQAEHCTDTEEGEINENFCFFFVLSWPLTDKDPSMLSKRARAHRIVLRITAPLSGKFALLFVTKLSERLSVFNI